MLAAKAPSSRPRRTAPIDFPAINPIKNNIAIRLRSLSNNPVLTEIIPNDAITKIRKGGKMANKEGTAF